MNDNDNKKIRSFLHAISNDLAISVGNVNILVKKNKDGNISLDEFTLRTQKVLKGLDSALEKISEHRDWVLGELESSDSENATNAS